MAIRGFQKILAVVFAVVVFTAAKAGSGPGVVQAIDYKQLSNGQAIERIEIRGDVSIVLSNTLGTNVLLEGNNKDIDVVKTTLKDGALEINAERKKSLSKLTVYVPVNDIHLLVVTGNARISSSGVSVDNLDIVLNGDSFVEVHHEGKLRVMAGDGFELADVAKGHEAAGKAE